MDSNTKMKNKKNNEKKKMTKQKKNNKKKKVSSLERTPKTRTISLHKNDVVRLMAKYDEASQAIETFLGTPNFVDEFPSVYNAAKARNFRHAYDGQIRDLMVKAQNAFDEASTFVGTSAHLKELHNAIEAHTPEIGPGPIPISLKTTSPNGVIDELVTYEIDITDDLNVVQFDEHELVLVSAPYRNPTSDLVPLIEEDENELDFVDDDSDVTPKHRNHSIPHDSEIVLGDDPDVWTLSPIENGNEIEFVDESESCPMIDETTVTRDFVATIPIVADDDSDVSTDAHPNESDPMFTQFGVVDDDDFDPHSTCVLAARPAPTYRGANQTTPSVLDQFADTDEDFDPSVVASVPSVLTIIDRRAEPWVATTQFEDAEDDATPTVDAALSVAVRHNNDEIVVAAFDPFADAEDDAPVRPLCRGTRAVSKPQEFHEDEFEDAIEFDFDSFEDDDLFYDTDEFETDCEIVTEFDYEVSLSHSPILLMIIMLWFSLRTAGDLIHIVLSLHLHVMLIIQNLTNTFLLLWNDVPQVSFELIWDLLYLSLQDYYLFYFDLNCFEDDGEPQASATVAVLPGRPTAKPPFLHELPLTTKPTNVALLRWFYLKHSRFKFASFYTFLFDCTKYLKMTPLSGLLLHVWNLMKTVPTMIAESLSRIPFPLRMFVCSNLPQITVFRNLFAPNRPGMTEYTCVGVPWSFRNPT